MWYLLTVEQKDVGQLHKINNKEKQNVWQISEKLYRAASVSFGYFRRDVTLRLSSASGSTSGNTLKLAAMPYHHVELEEKNVPGAILPYKNVDSNSCVSLRRWLQTRGLSSTGNKRDLVERVENCIDADLPIDISIDGGKWYQLQCQKTNDTAEVKSSKLPVPPVTLTGWNNFPSVAIPKYFNNGHIYHYIVESACVNGQASSPDEIMDVKTSKPLRRGLDFFKSGHIQDMKDCRRGNFYFCKSTVRASFENKAYDVLVTIDSNTGVVKDGSCDCKASAMGKCSHISGLLQAIADYQSRFGSEACTSKPSFYSKEVEYGKEKEKEALQAYAANLCESDPKLR
ncbi:hypothetical protein BaRGS_00022735, partial [Batillaria attramentaria]